MSEAEDERAAVAEVTLFEANEKFRVSDLDVEQLFPTGIPNAVLHRRSPSFSPTGGWWNMNGLLRVMNESSSRTRVRVAVGVAMSGVMVLVTFAALLSMWGE
jgi:hypothetical protein